MGRCWQRPFSPCSHINKVKPIKIRDALIALFARWGLPEAIRVDNGEPFGDPMRKSIPTLALWLISLGITVIWNRPRMPTDNAVVERLQDTSQRWAEVEKCTHYHELENRLKAVALTQREQYRVSRLSYRTRLRVYPKLDEVKPVDASEQFDAQRAYAYLAQTRFVRRAGKRGTLSLNGYGYYVGSAYSNQDVGIVFDPDACKWLFYDQFEKLITTKPAKTLSPAHIWSVAVTKAEASTFCPEPESKP